MDQVTKDQMLGALRIVVPLLLTLAVSQHWIPAEKVGEYGDLIVNGIVGAIAAGSVVWSIIRHSKVQQIQATAAIPEVKKVVTTSAIADVTLADDPKVTAH